jgi:hypothetical protein
MTARITFGVSDRTLGLPLSPTEFVREMHVVAALF